MNIITQLSTDELKSIIQEALNSTLKELKLISDEKETYIKRDRAAFICNVSPQTMHLRMKKGYYKTKRIGRHVLVSQNDIIESISEKELDYAKERNLI